MRSTNKNGAVRRIERAYNREALRRVLEMPERDFAEAYEMVTISIPEREKDPNEGYYHFRDNGSDVLAVAHLDTVAFAHERTAHFVSSEDGKVVFSRALDDRLGAYVLLELLPALGVNHDILLTVGEEDGMSTAEFFEPPKDYNWVIEFDRGGTDVVMYQYEDDETVDLVRECGAVVGDGIFSDISYLEHLGIKAFNWGVGYRDYHGPRSHAFLNDTFDMVAHYLRFHRANASTRLDHEHTHPWGYGRGASWSDGYGDDWYAAWNAEWEKRHAAGELDASVEEFNEEQEGVREA